jgi:hypothetical protein
MGKGTSTEKAMKHLGGGLVAAALLALAFGNAPAPAQVHSDKDLVVKVRKAIARGIDFMRRQQQNNGGWEVDQDAALQALGGRTALAVVALLNAGVRPEDPMIQKGLRYLRGLNSDSTYVRALQTMAFAEARSKEDQQRIQENIDWLIKARVLVGGELRGWGYTPAGTATGTTDNSNSQYAVLGLFAGRHAGAVVPRDVWDSVLKFYQTTQLDEGAWAYSKTFGSGPRFTMTTAGLSGLLIAAAELNDRREKPRNDGTFSNCGKYDDDAHVQKAIKWVGRHFNIERTPHIYYNLYGIERAGRLSGQRFFGNVDWYRDGCKFLVERQLENGSWNEQVLERWPVVCTSFALLFLAKGRTPILMTKIVHGPFPNRGTDWNNDRNDLHHLVNSASENLFKRPLPLGWQIFDAMRPLVRTPQELDDLVSELLPSPIVYFNGHQAPQFTAREKEVLKKYVENGGFLLAEACCGSKAFDRGVHGLMLELFGKENPLTDLPADHPVWKAFHPVPPGSFKLKGIQMGCKTVVIYSPEDLSCYWENNDKTSARGLLAFRTGENIIAYATGREPPPDRLTPGEVVELKDERTPPRGYLQVGQLRFAGDWSPAPRAISILMKHLRETAKLNVTLEREALPVNDKSLSNFPVLYMHGRGNVEFADKDLSKLRFHLENGGLLLADSCCGKDAFDKSFRQLVKQLFPKQALQKVPADDILFSKELNTVPLNEQSIRCRRLAGGEFQPTAPLLEGIKIDDRWVVLYSKYDLGCALERHQSSDCLGYDHASALRIGSAVVFYMLRP